MADRRHIHSVPAPPQPAWLTDALAGVPAGRVVAGLAAELKLIG